ncbi:uncharacterized protein Dana_GF27822 [Drosophila ananassae]|uniref:BPTI/Kunitz inhibitor domain-containing protein n=1 Tax=Drosophila ananassae TaxID=7217 RepID=A0A0P8XHD4_DROAN|nr:uncharacterized protein Dana_GF27822 [Drosophila ananassae]
MKYSTFFLLFLVNFSEINIPTVAGYEKEKCDAIHSNGGPCRIQPTTMWTFIKRQKRCIDIDYFGCPDTKNIFKSEDECRKACSFVFFQ